MRGPLPKLPNISTSVDHSEQFDEERLLGIQSKQHAPTISIVKPKTEWEKAEMPHLHSGGPKPTNTLGRPNNQANVRAARSLGKTTPSTFAKLEIESVTKDTPSDLSISRHWTNGPTEERAHKRQKKRHHTSELTSSSSSNTAEELSCSNVNADGGSSQVTRNVTLKSRNDSIGAGTKQNLDLQSPFRHENRRIRGMMDSSKSTRAKKKWLRRESSEKDDSRNSQMTSPTSGPISIYDSEDEVQMVRTGRTKKGSSAILHNTAQAIGPNHDSRPDNSSNLNQSKPDLPLRRPELQNNVNRLRNAFIGIDGTRRGESHEPSSPDELTADNTTHSYRSWRPSSPHKHDHHQNARDIPIHQTRQISGKEKPRIKSRRDPQVEATPEPWHVEVNAINRPVVLQHADGPPWRLTYDPATEEYTFENDDNEMRQIAARVRIALRAVRLIWYARGGTKIHIKSSSQEEIRDNIVEFDISHQVDMEKVLEHLQHLRPLHCVGQDKSRMDRIFAVSRQELKKRPLPAALPSSPEGRKSPDSGARDMNKETWDREMDEARNKQPRTKVVHDLLERTHSERIESQQNAKIALSAATKTARSDNQAMSNISSILGKLNPEPASANPVTRRSTRLSGSSGLNFANLADQDLDVEPEKFSKTHGLGPRWRRPLTYPPEGKKKATVDWLDLEKLDEGEFLNDALVTFKMRQLEFELEENNPELAKRIYFFNTFFYGRLTDGVPAKDINYSAVQKWTKNIDIFSYDYVVVPINEMAHWYLVIICNLPGLERAMSFAEGTLPVVQPKAEDASTTPGSRGSDSTQKDATEDIPTSPTEAHVSGSFAEISLEDRELPSKPNIELMSDFQRGPAAEADGEDGDTLSVPQVGALSDHGRTRQSPEEVQAQRVNSITEFDSPSKQTRPHKKPKRKSTPAVMNIDPSAPLMVVLDSLEGNHPTVTRRLKDYLAQEAIAKRGGMEINAGAIKGINARSVPLQSNFSDCGLYMLGYLDKFLQDGPDFVRKTIKREYKDDWSIDSSAMRTELRKLIYKLHDSQESKARAAKALKNKQDDKREKTTVSDHGDDHSKFSAHDQGSPSDTAQHPRPTTRREALNVAQNLDGAVGNNNPGITTPPTASKMVVKPTSAKEQYPTAEKKLENGRLPSEMHAGKGSAQDDARSQDDESVVVLESQSGPVGLASRGNDYKSPSIPVVERRIPMTGHEANRELPAEIEDSQEKKQESRPQSATPPAASPPPILEPARSPSLVKDSFEIIDSAPPQKKRTRTMAEKGSEAERPPQLPPRKVVRGVRDLPVHRTQDGASRQAESSKRNGQAKAMTSPLTYSHKRRGQPDSRDGDVRQYLRSPPVGSLPTSEKFRHKQKAMAEDTKVEMQFVEGKRTPTRSDTVIDLE